MLAGCKTSGTQNKIFDYRPIGRRRHGRPLKITRQLWGRNRSFTGL